MYKPLPDSVEIKNSPIHGVGLFAKTPIKNRIHLRISHVFAPGFKGDHIRTPVGGFVNHSEDSNCYKQESPEESVITYYSLVTSRDIEKDEELTLTYTLYNV